MKYNHFKLKLRAFIAVLVMFVFGVSANAQQISVSGIVKDAANGEPILGASVIEKGTTKGVITNINGAFTISVASSATLTVKYIGYTTVEIPVSGKRNLIIELKENAVSLGEVVAIGYGTVKKNDATGSVTAIKPDKLNKGLTTNAQDMIVGKIAGVNVISGGGTPGGGSTIRIRGGSSLNASNDPLIVIDGLAIDNNGIKGVSNLLSTINPNDIESFTVLKDASATAIYGSRASNGVILITTKKGEKGSKPHVSYDGNMSLSSIGKTIDVMSGDQFRQYVTDLYGSGSEAVKALGTANTDWQKAIYQTGLSTDHNISVSGGFKNMPYRVSLGYTNQTGIIKNSSFERYTGSISLNPTFFDDYLKININAKSMIVKNRYANTDAVGAALTMDPTQPIMSTDEPFATQFGGYWQWYTNNTINGNATKNPVSMLNLKNDVSNANDIIANIDFDYKLHFFTDVHAHLNMATDASFGQQDTWISAQEAQDYVNGGSTNWDKQNKYNRSLNAYLQYNKEFSNQKVDVMAGYEWQHFHRSGSYFKSPLVGNHIYQAAIINTATENYLVSFFGRLNYTLADKYLFTATLRDDGSSRFATNNRWGLFPSAAFAWKINEEGFLKNNNTISDLKLRLGYGVTGQQNISDNDYSYLPIYTTNKDGAYYPFGSTYYPTSRPAAYNPNLKWEETTTYNSGIDISIIKGRYTASIDYYYRRTDNLLNNVSVAAGTNFSNKVISNIGTLQNQGVEFTMNGKLISTKDFVWDLNYNVTYNQNKINKLTSGNTPGYYVATGGIFQGSAQAHAVGFPSNSFYVYQQIYGTNGKPIEGLYVDRNGDGQITEADKYFYHNSNPDVTMGLSSKVIYKNFDLGIAFHASIGNYMYNGVAAQRLNVGATGIWSKGYLSNIALSGLETNFADGKIDYLSDYYVQNASFVRCDNITFGYTFKNLFNVISSGRLYATVQNPFVITKYKGLDPEVYGGIDGNIYPKPVVTLFGLSLNF